MQNRRVFFYVDDCGSIGWLVQKFFQARYPRFEIVVHVTPEDALRDLEARRDTPGWPKAIVTDLHFQNTGTDGFWLIRKLREAFPRIRTIIVSGTINPKECEQARNAGADAFVQKDMDIESLVARLFDLIDAPTDLFRRNQTQGS